MKIRRFFAKDMRTALAEVSKELGPDAAILSSRKIGGGVELMAAIDYDPSVLSEKRQPVTRESESVADFAARNSAAEAPGSASASSHAAWEQLLAASRVVAGLEEGQSRLESERQTTGSLAESRSAFRSTLAANANLREQSQRAIPASSEMLGRNAANGYDRGSAADGRASPSAQSTSLPRLADTSTAMEAHATPVQKLQIEWGDDPGLKSLREEMRQLRGLFVDQLQGLAWKDFKQQHPCRAFLARRLSLMELSPKWRDHYASVEGEDTEHALAQAIAAMARDVVNTTDDLLSQGGMYALIGPTGVGKTTTIAKLAARFAMQHGAHSVALISTDSYRIAAHDQLRVFARLIGCSVRTVEHADQLPATLDAVVDKRLVLIDSAGMSQNDLRLQEALAMLDSDNYPLKRLLVLSATAQRGMLAECVKQFGQKPLHGAILTKLDEATSLGPVLSLLLDSRLPLFFGCDGQRVPEDLRPLRGVQLVERARRLAELNQEGVDEWSLAQEFKVASHARA